MSIASLQKNDFMKYTDLNNIVSSHTNISERERLISGVSGGLLLALGLFDFRKSCLRRASRMTIGSLLIIRGLTGYCPVKASVTSTDEGTIDENT